MKSHFRALPPNNPRKVRGKKKVDVGEDDQNHTSSTRSTLTVLTDSAEVPMLVMRAPVRRREIVNQIGGAYIHHPSILEQSLVHSQIDATAFVTLTDPALYSGCRWIGIQEKYGLEKELCAKFFHLLMQLLDLWMEQPKQSNKVHNIIDTQGICLRDDREPSHTLSPDIFVQGTGPLFSPLPGTGKTPNWGSCVAIGDAKLNIARNKMDTFGQLGTYVAQIFSAQENRRFVPTFCFDNSRLLWCTFDRGGAVYGDAVDYHSDPWKLCALVLHFLFDGKDIGMDPSIRHDDDLTVISTTPPPEGSSGAAPSLHVPTASYVVRRTLFHSTNIRGSGTVYWLAQRRKPLNDSGIQKDDDSEHWCIIKDAWVVNGSERERTIYDRIHTSLTQGTRKGIAPLLFTHDVFFAGRLDSVSINRPRGVKTPVGENRVHTRAVFHATAGAKLLDHFSGEMELLVAVRDAIQGHRRLHNHGVIHGNVTPYRILIQPDAPEGDRGVLLDFASAAPREGSRAFYSYKAAMAAKNGLAFDPSYFDDMESFFYVLCYSLVCYPSSGSLKPKIIPPSVSAWFGPFGGWQEKRIMMTEHTLPLSIDPSFHPTVSQLLMSLHSLFRAYTLVTVNYSQDWRPEPEIVYDGILSCLNDAIESLKAYYTVSNSGSGPTSTNDTEVPSSIHNVSRDDATLRCRTSVAVRHNDKRRRSPSPRSSKRVKSDHP